MPAEALPKTDLKSFVEEMTKAWSPQAHMAAAFLLGIASTLLVQFIYRGIHPSLRPTQMILRLDVDELSSPAVARRAFPSSQLPTTTTTGARVIMSESSSAGPGRQYASARSKEAQLLSPIELNGATTADLQRLPGIGPRLAQRIVDERSKAPFRDVADVRRVSGIGPKTLERLRPHVYVAVSSKPAGGPSIE